MKVLQQITEVKTLYKCDFCNTSSFLKDYMEKHELSHNCSHVDCEYSLDSTQDEYATATINKRCKFCCKHWSRSLLDSDLTPEECKVIFERKK